MGGSSGKAGKRPKRILAVMLEFNDWVEAKPWSYLASYALLDGFEACGAEWTMLPSLLILGDRSLNPWVDARESLLAGETFDQVWVWLTHAHFPDDFWPWLERIAPVRVGVLMESLRYSEEDLKVWEGFGWRFDAAVAQAAHLTHLVSYDESDVAELAAATGRPASLFQSMIPAAMIRDLPAPTAGKPMFLGTIYGKRERFLAAADLGDRIQILDTPEAGTGLQDEFNALTSHYLDQLRAGRAAAADMRVFALGLKDIRRRVLEGVLDVYRGGTAVLTLPAYFRGLTGRVTEAMAAGVPMINNRLQDRPETSALFLDREHIIYYDAEDPADLARQIDAVDRDQALRDRIVRNARARLLERLTSEAQMPKLQAWIDRTTPTLPAPPSLVRRALRKLRRMILRR